MHKLSIFSSLILIIDVAQYLSPSSTTHGHSNYSKNYPLIFDFIFDIYLHVILKSKWILLTLNLYGTIKSLFKYLLFLQLVYKT